MERTLETSIKRRTLIIKGRLDSLNDYTKACRTMAVVGANCKRKNEDIIVGAILEQLNGVHFTGRTYLHFRWIEANSKRDLDNVCFAKKFILDALVRCGVIETDGWKGVFGFTDEFDIDAFNPRIEVVIEGKEKPNEEEKSVRNHTQIYGNSQERDHRKTGI